jgi:hypothetical protein
MNDRDERPTDVLAEAHEQEGDPPGDPSTGSGQAELGGGLGNSERGGANDG